jgi:long-chain acyl-CoA synthetase
MEHMPLDIELYRRTIYAPPARSTQGPQRISVIDIHPKGATRTLLFVHGYGGSASHWLHQLRFFGQSMRVLAPDQRGHALSDDPVGLPYTMDGLVDDLEVVLDALQVQGPIHLIGHSFGGAVASEYAVRHPERLHSLVLIGVATHFTLPPGLERVLIIPDPFFSYVTKRLGAVEAAPQRTLKGLADDVLATWRMQQQIRVPTLIILGHRDRVFRRERFEGVLRYIPDAQLVEIPVSAHMVILERPDAVNRAISRFLEKRPPEALAGTVMEQKSTQQDEPQRARLATQRRDMPWLQHYDSGVPAQIPQPKHLLHELLSDAARAFPGRPAIVFFGKRIRYRQLDHLSTRFAHALRGLGIKAGDRVAIVLPNIPQCVIAFYGALKAGAIVVLGNPLLPEQELRRQLRDAGAQVLLTLESLRGMAERVCPDTSIRQVIFTDVREYLPLRWRPWVASLIEERPLAVELEGSHTLSFASDTSPSRTGVMAGGAQGTAPSEQALFRASSFQHLLRRQPSRPLESGTTSDDLALIQYTAGMTGSPKGVMLSHGNLVANIVQRRHWMTDAKRGQEVVLSMLPLSHMYGITTGMNMAVALAGALVLVPTSRTDQVLQAMKRYRPTLFSGTPALYLAIANYPKVRRYGIATIRVCVSGSAPLPVEVQEAFEKLTRGHLVEAYALTEASPSTHANPHKGERRLGSIGLPLPSTDARIVDRETGEPLPPGAAGDLLIRGPQVMRGYWNLPEETALALRDGWLHTGDVARMDEDGFFTVIGRKQDLILSGPYQVYPRDVEEVLYEHPKVLEVAVVSMPAKAEQDDGCTASAPAPPFIKAFVVLKRGQRATTEELLAYARKRLDAYQVPHQIEFRTKLPKNSVGKVLRDLLIQE